MKEDLDRLLQSADRLERAKRLPERGPGWSYLVRRETTLLVRRAWRVLWRALREWVSARRV